jgi:hypothetical protein
MPPGLCPVTSAPVHLPQTSTATRLPAPGSSATSSQRRGVLPGSSLGTSATATGCWGCGGWAAADGRAVRAFRRPPGGGPAREAASGEQQGPPQPRLPLQRRRRRAAAGRRSSSCSCSKRACACSRPGALRVSWRARRGRSGRSCGAPARLLQHARAGEGWAPSPGHRAAGRRPLQPRAPALAAPAALGSPGSDAARSPGSACLAPQPGSPSTSTRARPACSRQGPSCTSQARPGPAKPSGPAAQQVQRPGGPAAQRRSRSSERGGGQAGTRALVLQPPASLALCQLRAARAGGAGRRRRRRQQVAQRLQGGRGSRLRERPPSSCSLCCTPSPPPQRAASSAGAPPVGGRRAAPARRPCASGPPPAAGPCRCWAAQVAAQAAHLPPARCSASCARARPASCWGWGPAGSG